MTDNQKLRAIGWWVGIRVGVIACAIFVAKALGLLILKVI